MIAHASGYNTAAAEIGAETKVPVAIVDKPSASKPGMVADYTVSGYEGAYLAGRLAAKMTKTGTVGIVVSAEPLPFNSQSAAFAQGVKAEKADTKILYAVIGPAAYSDAAGGRRVTETVIGAGADVIFGQGDGSSFGMLQATETTKTAKGDTVWFIDIIGDKSKIDKGTLLSSVVWNLVPVYTAMVEDLKADRFGTHPYKISLADDSRTAAANEAHSRCGVGPDHGHPQGHHRRQDQDRADLRCAKSARADDLGRREKVGSKRRCTQAIRLAMRLGMAAMIEQASAPLRGAPPATPPTASPQSTARHHQAVSRRRRQRRYLARRLRRRDSRLARRERRGKIDPDQHSRRPAAAGRRHHLRARTIGADRLAAAKASTSASAPFSSTCSWCRALTVLENLMLGGSSWRPLHRQPALDALPRAIRASRRRHRSERAGRTACAWRTTAGRNHACAVARRAACSFSTSRPRC